MRHDIVKATVLKRESANIRRWQCESVGALWQLDVTPHRWFGEQNDQKPLFDMIDDCSRVMVGTRLYPRECLLAYLDFMRISFEKYGLPTCLHVDFHSFFFSALPDMLTYLGEVLKWIGISFKYAPTAQAKGKVERQHLFWQNRLPAYFAAEHIDQIDQANVHIDELRTHHNEHEIHREIEMTPATAWRKAIKEKRSVLRERPVTPWWSYLWTVRNIVKISLDGTICLGPTRIKLANEFGIGNPIVIRRLEGSRQTWSI